MTEADKNLPDEVELNAKQICLTARETTRSLDEIVWAVNPANDTLEGLANYACKYAQDYFALAGMRYRADVPAQLPSVAIATGGSPQCFSRLQGSRQQCCQTRAGIRSSCAFAVAGKHFTLNVEDNGRGLGNLEARQNCGTV